MAESVSLSYVESELSKKSDIYVLKDTTEQEPTVDIDCKYNYLTLDDHITGDMQRWQQISDSNAAMYAAMVQIAQDVYAGTIPDYDISQGVTIAGAGGILTLGGGGSYTVPKNGYIIVMFSAGLLSTSVTVSVNGVEKFNSGIGVLGISGGPTATIQVNTNDSITIGGTLSLGGSFNVTFYPNKSL